jgi:hypothetical protein
MEKLIKVQKNGNKHTYPLIGKILLIIFGIVLALISIEIILRVLNYPYIGCKNIDEASEYSIGRYDSDLGWGYTPHSSILWNNIRYTFNSEGYRSDSIDSRTDFSKPIILVVGDSSLFGHDLNYTDTFSYKLQNRLNDSYQVINFAVQGFGLDQIYLRLQQVMDIYKPVFVITDLIDDQDNRNINRDRRYLIPCLKIRGTKPVFSLQNNSLVLLHRPEPYETYDNPRIRLVLRRLMDAWNQHIEDKTKLSKTLYTHLKEYVESRGVELLVINYLSEIRDYQTENNVLGISTVVKEEYDKNNMLEDDWHPNATGTTRMVDDILAKIQ